MFTRVTRCRLCGNQTLASVLHLGEQHLTGVFPRHLDDIVTRGPLELVKCHADPTVEHCGLLQLRHSYDPSELYGDNYGYRSSLNRSMVEHLRVIVEHLRRTVPLREGDLVVDIGSNDGTLLSFYPPHGVDLVGIDPTAKKFSRFYRPHIGVVADLFSADDFLARFGDRRAKIVTSIAMLYDLERPLRFMEEVERVLADDGIWYFEQSYLPSMLQANAYDTICHEHVEYYALHQIKYMTGRAGFKILDVTLDDTNGGSFAVTVAKSGAPYSPNTPQVEAALRAENALGLASLIPYRKFRNAVFSHRGELMQLLVKLRNEGRRVFGYGASTKGNVLLQLCGLTPRELPCIAEVNEDKFGCHTPGTGIPIVSEADAHALNPDYFLVLPWHFRRAIVQREAAFLARGGRLIFPLPRVEIV